jgi:hypothetical protein
MPTAILATYLLILNAIWDLVTGLGILVFIYTGHLKQIADTHLGLWILDEDRENKVVSILIAAIIIQWAAVRSFAAADPSSRWPDATFTYWIEGVMIAVAATMGRTHAFPSAMVLVLCVGCAGVMVSVGIDP